MKKAYAPKVDPRVYYEYGKIMVARTHKKVDALAPLLFMISRYSRVFADNLVGLGFLWSVSNINPILTHEKYLLWEKVAQMPFLT